MRQFGAILAIGLSAALGVVPAAASGGGHDEKPNPAAEGESPVAAGPSDRELDIPVVTVPLVDDRGRLVEYAFVGIRIRAESSSKIDRIKADLPLLQDALVRAVNGPPLASAATADADLRAALLVRIKTAASSVIANGATAEVLVKDVVRSSP